MIFDFERCFFEPTSWNFTGPFKGLHETKEQAKKWLKENNIDGPVEEFIRFRTCNQYSELKMKFVDEEISIRFYDEDIEKMIIAIRSAHKRGDNYVFCNLQSFHIIFNNIFYEVNNNINEPLNVYTKTE